jgi:hypothetical protein
MVDYSQLWKPHSFARGKTLELELGSLHLWIHRGNQEWHIAHETESVGEDRYALSIAEGPFEAQRKWTRWILDEKIETIQLKPQLPDRPLIVRPDMPMCLMPKQSVQFFVGIPLWLAIFFGNRQEQVVEIPSQKLSNSWFGPFTEGELCYAMKTTAKLSQENLTPSAQRVVFPLEVRNASKEKLNFVRLCLRPQYLNIYQGETRLWTNKARVSYRGEDHWSRFVYASAAPEFDRAAHLLGNAREAMQRGALLKTFDTLKQRVEIA